MGFRIEIPRLRLRGQWRIELASQRVNEIFGYDNGKIVREKRNQGERKTTGRDDHRHGFPTSAYPL